jgi:hypothetical protein
MPHLLDRMPFPAETSEIAVRGERVRVRADQIIVWVSLSVREVLDQSPAVVPFPAILDTGHNHSFSLREQHLVTWAGIRPEALPLRGHTRDREQRVELRVANLWAHVNERGSREGLADEAPFLLRARTGIAVYSVGDFPRLPLLGLRVIAENNLVLKVDGPKRFATLRTPIKWWRPFA